MVLTYYLLREYSEKLFNGNESYVEYIRLILMETLVFTSAIIAYSLSIKGIKIEYKDYKEELYFAHCSQDSLRLKMNELSRNPQALDDITLKEHFESVINFLVEKAWSLQNLISFTHIDENSLKPIDESIIKYNATMINTTSHEYSPLVFKELSQKVFEDFYFKYVTLQLVIPSIVSIIINFIVLVAMGRIEYTKYRIRKASQQEPALEMLETGSAEENVVFSDPAIKSFRNVNILN
ncbi:hypothetical protein Avbf_12240 [Armadillidium vulgare]|nr:hypothetical protein Avbf_12240 [Armadillidium vulgare]